MYYLGIDAGGTKTRARLINESGEIIGEGLSGPGNARLGVPLVFASISAAYTQAIKAAGLSTKDIASIRAGFGVAGIGRIGALEQLHAQPFPFHKTTIVNDAKIANIGAHSGEDGGIVIIGTGSIGIARLDGKDIRAGGYGFPISDEGSGAYIGLQAVRITLRASDGRLEHSDLTQKIFDKFDRDTHAIVSWMDQATATEYATMAPDVVDAAESGDYHGRLITSHAAWHIEIIVRGLFGLGVPRVALLGGLASRIEPWMSPDIRLKLTQPQGDALDGALWLARQSNID
ncbi:BadF/BadG/BcrA/BcrD ATPase family protein [Robiginitomaculum antarcticum]|uniref:BadF/BadG/BcrA/BcrD ATPase family protein n=1 Tax=Robiginitomaculum antarcticum TaxID=437507 RepID=UPI00037743AD|nr:BadF/BadG/BcrA/BcrD ATPase family protein [Robiginitomaculum antarcticum]